MERKGTILVPSSGNTVPLRIRDHHGTVVGAGVSGKPIEVVEGRHHIGAILADGSEVLLDEAVTVVAGGNVVAPALPVEAAELSAEAPPGERSVEPLTARRWRGDWLASIANLPTPLQPSANGFQAEPIALSPNVPTLIERDCPLDDLLVVDHAGRRSIHVLPLDRFLFSDGSTEASGVIEVEARVTGKPLILRYTSPIDPAANAFLNYVENALLSESRAISADFIARGQGAMREQGSSLLSAMVSGYVLLRANQLDGLDRWTEQLIELTPAMPDAYALHAETMARMGFHDRAVNALRSSLDKGCPWFRSGLSYSLERLRLYLDVHGGKSAFRLSDEDLANFQLRKALMERSAIHLDTTALFTTFRSAAQD